MSFECAPKSRCSARRCAICGRGSPGLRRPSDRRAIGEPARCGGWRLDFCGAIDCGRHNPSGIVASSDRKNAAACQTARRVARNHSQTDRGEALATGVARRKRKLIPFTQLRGSYPRPAMRRSGSWDSWEIAFFQDKAVMQLMTGDDERQGAHGNLILAGHTAVRPRIPGKRAK
jgi:hypothetical protein